MKKLLVVILLCACMTGVSACGNRGKQEDMGRSAEAGAESGAGTGSGTEAGTDTGAGTDSGTEADAGKDTGAGTGTGADTEKGTGTGTGTKADTEKGTGAGSSTKAGTGNSTGSGTKTGEKAEENYDSYTGMWSVDGKAHQEILAGGGVEIICTVTNGNHFSGSLHVQQSGTERFADVDDISGVIENSELYFSFADDGWGGKGTLHIRFAENRIVIETTEYRMAEDNRIGYGVNGSYEMIRAAEQGSSNPAAEEWKPDEMYTAFLERFYPGLSSEEIEKKALEEGRMTYYRASKYYEDVTYYWEQIRGVTDISNRIEPLYYTDMKYYSEDDFKDVPAVIIHLAKNEIYARHGYIFKDADLNNYFMGCAWYQPVCSGDDFDAAVFNDYERKNLELLVSLE